MVVSNTPYIGITPASKSDLASYQKILEQHGGIVVPVLMDSGQDAKYQMSGIQGLLVLEWSLDPFVIPLLKDVLERDMPVLAVNQGMYALNMVLGGGDPEDVSGHSVAQSEDSESAYHRIFITPGSKMAAIIGSGGFVRVNSRHLQGLTERQRSPHLMASAYALDDGIIEGLESPGHDWVIGVQFSPDRRMELPPHFDRLFQGFVERAETRSAYSPDIGSWTG